MLLSEDNRPTSMGLVFVHVELSAGRFLLDPAKDLPLFGQFARVWFLPTIQGRKRSLHSTIIQQYFLNDFQREILHDQPLHRCGEQHVGDFQLTIYAYHPYGKATVVLITIDIIAGEICHFILHFQPR